MTLKKILYILLVMVTAGASALTGAIAGGAVVYKTVGGNQSGSPAISIPASNSNANNTPNQTLVLNSTDIETSITQAVQKVGPAVVTIVGTIPGQMTFFGQTGDQTVSHRRQHAKVGTSFHRIFPRRCCRHGSGYRPHPCHGIWPRV